MRTTNNHRRGFTLKELMVTVTILCALFALMAIGLNQTGSRSRGLRCATHLDELAHATATYVSQHNGYPGYSRRLRNGNRATWVVTLLPQMDEEGIYSTWMQPATSPQMKTLTRHIPATHCPLEPDKSGAELSYVANCGSPNNIKAPDFNGNGVFVNCYPSSKDSPQSYPDWKGVTPALIRDGESQTLLFTENLQAGNWNADPAPNTPPASDEACQRLTGFVFFDDDHQGLGTRRINRGKDDPGPATSMEYSRPSSRHPRGVNVAYCGGHVTFLSETIDYDVYRQLMTIDNDKATGNAAHLPPLVFKPED